MADCAFRVYLRRVEGDGYVAVANALPGTCPLKGCAARYLSPGRCPLADWQKLIKVKEEQLTQKMRGFSGNLTNFANGM